MTDYATEATRYAPIETRYKHLQNALDRCVLTLRPTHTMLGVALFEQVERFCRRKLHLNRVTLGVFGYEDWIVLNQLEALRNPVKVALINKLLQTGVLKELSKKAKDKTFDWGLWSCYMAAFSPAVNRRDVWEKLHQLFPLFEKEFGGSFAQELRTKLQSLHIPGVRDICVGTQRHGCSSGFLPTVHDYWSPNTSVDGNMKDEFVFHVRQPKHKLFTISCEGSSTNSEQVMFDIMIPVTFSTPEGKITFHMKVFRLQVDKDRPGVVPETYVLSSRQHVRLRDRAMLVKTILPHRRAAVLVAFLWAAGRDIRPQFNHMMHVLDGRDEENGSTVRALFKKINERFKGDTLGLRRFKDTIRATLEAILISQLIGTSSVSFITSNSIDQTH